jgi:hypothetical protein
MLEASDHNPSLLGRTASEISKIQIISEDQYAEYIRAKTTIAQFSARFQATRDALDRARKALENLDQANQRNDPQAAAEALQQACKAHEDAIELLDNIAQDFPAFELEKRLQELAEKQANDLRENLQGLENADDAAIDEMLKRLGKHQQQADQLEEDVALTKDAAQLLEMAAKFRQVYENQKSLAKRFGTIVDEFRHGNNQNRRLLPSLADGQRKNREALDEFKLELKKRLEALQNADPLLDPLSNSAAQFLTDLEAAAPETLMDAATEHGKTGKANEAFTNADLARELLERLLSNPAPFPEAAMGKAPKFEVPRLDVNQNIEQMLKSLLGQNPGAPGTDGTTGEGQGHGGFGPGGVAMNGIPMDVPVVGPERLQFDPLSSASDGGGGEGKAGAVAPLPENAEAGTLKPTETRQGESATFSPESIPEPYREAVKRYFTP